LTGRRWLSNWGSNRKKLEAQSKVLPYHGVNFCFDGEALATIIQVTTLAPAREKVRKMFAAYRPALRGNGEGQRTVDVQAEPVGADPTDTRSAEDAAISESVRRKFAHYRPDNRARFADGATADYSPGRRRKFLSQW